MSLRGRAEYYFRDIIGNNDILESCKAKAIKASKTTSPVLIYGETGTGKEMFVQAIHNGSIRFDRPFIAQNCAAIPASLLESILFGTVKGSFTGAEDRKGLFELADGGTLYLDELNSMPVEFQVKLLRVLQEGIIRRLGSSVNKYIDVRIITSLNELPEVLIENGTLRTDLYYRLNVVRIDLPSLRQRKEDIPLLISCFLEKYNKRFKASIKGIQPDALEKLIYMSWEGNIRELEHVIEGIFNLRQQGEIELRDLEELGIYKMTKMISLRDKMQEIEREYIKEALIASRRNISKAAELLQIPRQTLQSKLNKYKFL